MGVQISLHTLFCSLLPYGNTAEFMAPWCKTLPQQHKEYQHPPSALGSAPHPCHHESRGLPDDLFSVTAYTFCLPTTLLGLLGCLSLPDPAVPQATCSSLMSQHLLKHLDLGPIKNSRSHAAVLAAATIVQD